jgi:ERCC4-type nuclease
MKREHQPKLNYQLDLKWAEEAVFNRGFHAGAKEQRESDIECLVGLLEGLEEWSGIGEKTAYKIREHFMSKFGK